MKKLILAIILCTLASLAHAAISPVVNTVDAFAVQSLAVSGDGATIAAAFADGTIRTFYASSGRLKSSIKLPAAVKSFAFTDNNTKLVIAADKLYVAELGSGQYRLLNNKSQNIPALAADKEGKTAVAAVGSVLHFYNIASGQESFNLRSPSEIYALSLDDTSQTVAVGGKDGSIRVYSMINGKLVAEKKAGIGVILSLACANTGIIAGGEGGVKFFDKKLNEVAEQYRHTDAVRSVGITPDGRFAVSGGDDGLPVLWDIAANQATNAPLPKAMPVNAVAIDPYFRYALMGTAESLTLQYTANKNELRSIYAFRDATATLNKIGYVDGNGPFGKYISYADGNQSYTFAEASKTVHQPARLEYAMPQPRIAQRDVEITPQTGTAFEDTTPPEIVVNTRGFEVVAEDEIQSIEGTIRDISGVEWATIDDRPLVLDADGRFVAEYAATAIRNVVIAAADIYGNTASRTVALSSQTATTGDARKVALIVGVNKYKNLASLSTPEYDSRTVAELLRTQYGYETIMLLGAEATRDAIMTEINSLRRALTDKDRLIIYYAGHGDWDQRSGNAYWQPYDAIAGDDTRWIHTGQLASTLSAFAAPVLVISDSCYSGALREQGGVNGSLSLISSGGNEPVADKGGGEHSLFTNALVETLRAKTHTAAEVFDFISAKLKGKGQSPEYHILSGKRDFEL